MRFSVYFDSDRSLVQVDGADAEDAFRKAFVKHHALPPIGGDFVTDTAYVAERDNRTDPGWRFRGMTIGEGRVRVTES